MNCNTCKTEYEPMENFEKYEQAAGCAATLYLYEGTYYILAHYGSCFDMQRYVLRKDKYEVGHICDNCIKKYIDADRAQLIEDGVW